MLASSTRKRYVSCVASVQTLLHCPIDFQDDDQVMVLTQCSPSYNVNVVMLQMMKLLHNLGVRATATSVHFICIVRSNALALHLWPALEAM